MARDLRPVYTAVTEADAAGRLDEFHETWEAALKCLYLVIRPLDPKGSDQER